MQNISPVEVRQQVGEFIATYSHLAGVQDMRRALAVGLLTYDEAYKIAHKAMRDALECAAEMEANR